MHAIVLACYLCLQLSSLSDLSQNVIQKRDTACDQCVENLFTPHEIVYVFKSQSKTPGETLSSNPVLRETVQDRLAKYESKAESQEKPKEESEYEKQLRLEKFLAAEKQKDDEMRAQYNKMAEEIERELTEMNNQLNEKQTQLTEMNRQLIENQARLRREFREFEEYAKKRREDAKAPLPTARDNSFKHILRNGVRLMAGQYLLSENGRYKATMHESCFLVITDEFNDGRIVNRVGSPTHYTSGPECHMIMQGDGNMVTYNKIISKEKGSQVTWHTGTNSRKGAGYYVKLENDGEFVMYNQEHKRIWNHSNGRLKAHHYDL